MEKRTNHIELFHLFENMIIFKVKIYRLIARLEKNVLDNYFIVDSLILMKAQ